MPYSFDWSVLKKAQIVIEDNGQSSSSNSSVQNKPGVAGKEEEEVEYEIEKFEMANKNDRIIKFYRKLAYGSFIFVLLLTWVVWPLPLYRDWIWSEIFFKETKLTASLNRFDINL